MPEIAVLTQDAHDVLPLSQSVQKVLVAALDRSLLRVVYVSCPLSHDIRDVLHALNARDGNELEQETTEPCWTEMRHVWNDFPSP